jgi:hypothetical protein
MNKSDTGFDYDRYRKLLAEANDQPKRLALIKLLIAERAKDRLAGQSLHTKLTGLGLPKPGTDLRADLEPRPDVPVRDLSALATDFLRKRVAQADRSVEYKTVGL